MGRESARGYGALEHAGRAVSVLVRGRVTVARHFRLYGRREVTCREVTHSRSTTVFMQEDMDRDMDRGYGKP